MNQAFYANMNNKIKMKKKKRRNDQHFLPSPSLLRYLNRVPLQKAFPTLPVLRVLLPHIL
jgi:hypothetical protein